MGSPAIRALILFTNSSVAVAKGVEMGTPAKRALICANFSVASANIEQTTMGPSAIKALTHYCTYCYKYWNKLH